MFVLCWTYLSIATAQRICDPTEDAVGVHFKVIDHVVVVLRTIGVLTTIGNESVAISLMVTEVPQKLWAISWTVYVWPTWIPTQSLVVCDELALVRSGGVEHDGTLLTLIRNWTGILLIGVIEFESRKSSI